MPEIAYFLGTALLFVVTFLLGSIPWGVVISKLFFHMDLRDHGSGNIGTTNAMRTMGKAGGVAVFILDFGKGLLSGFLAYVAWWILEGLQPADSAMVSYFLPSFLGTSLLGCVWGHIFSPWLGFKGGKGIAVAIGALFFVFGWFFSLMEILLFAVVVTVSRYVSLGSIAAAILCPVIAFYLFLCVSFEPWAFTTCTVAAVTVIWAHRGNMKRLAQGTENRIGSKKTA